MLWLPPIFHAMPCHVSATSPAAFAARHRNARPRGTTGTIYVRRWCWGEPIGVTNLMAGKQKEGKTQGFLLGLGVLKLPLPSLPFLPAKKWKFILIFPGKKKIIKYYSWQLITFTAQLKLSKQDFTYAITGQSWSRNTSDSWRIWTLPPPKKKNI